MTADLIQAITGILVAVAGIAAGLLYVRERRRLLNAEAALGEARATDVVRAADARATDSATAGSERLVNAAATWIEKQADASADIILRQTEAYAALVQRVATLEAQDKARDAEVEKLRAEASEMRSELGHVHRYIDEIGLWAQAAYDENRSLGGAMPPPPTPPPSRRTADAARRLEEYRALSPSSGPPPPMNGVSQDPTGDVADVAPST